MIPGIVTAQSNLKGAGRLGTAATLLVPFDYQVLKSSNGQVVTLIEKAMWPSVPERAPAKYRGWGCS